MLHYIITVNKGWWVLFGFVGVFVGYFGFFFEEKVDFFFCKFL